MISLISLYLKLIFRNIIDKIKVKKSTQKSQRSQKEIGMNEFLSNPSTLIDPDSVYDQERFINILQTILHTKTQKELSEQTGLNNATCLLYTSDAADER